MNKVNEKWLETPESRLLVSQTEDVALQILHNDWPILPPLVLTVTTHKLAELQDWVGLVWFVSWWVAYTFLYDKYKIRLHVFANLLTSQNTNEFLVKKTKEKQLVTPTLPARSSVPFNTKGRPSKTKESDSLTVWGRLVAHNRCYPLINNTVSQGWASHPFEAVCINFDTHKKVLIALEVMG